MKANQRPFILNECTWKVVKDTGYQVAVLPWGATEPHNYHLPFSCDNLHSQYVAEYSAEYAWNRGAKVIVLPEVPFGVNTGQLNLKLTLNINPSTQLAILNDILDSLYHQGFEKFVILNGHGGNDFRNIIRELKPQYPGFYLCVVDWYNVLPWDEYFTESGDHAGEMETSILLEVAPDLVLPLEEAGKGDHKSLIFEGRKEGWLWSPREWSAVTEDTGIGNPEKATREKGKVYLDKAIEKIGEFFVQLDGADIDELYE